MAMTTSTTSGKNPYFSEIPEPSRNTMQKNRLSIPVPSPDKLFFLTKTSLTHARIRHSDTRKIPGKRQDISFQQILVWIQRISVKKSQYYNIEILGYIGREKSRLKPAGKSLFTAKFKDNIQNFLLTKQSELPPITSLLLSNHGYHKFSSQNLFLVYSDLTVSF